MPDILTWLLKIDAQVDGAEKLNAALKHAETELHGVDAALKHTEGATRAASAAHHGHADAAEHAEGALHRLVHAGLEPFLERAKQIAEFEFIRKGVDTLLEAPVELLEKLKEVGEEIIKASSAEERLGKSFELNLGVEGGEEAIAYAEKFAKSTEFADSQTKDFASSLIQAGVPLEELDKFMAAAGDVAAKSKDPIEGMAAAIEGLSRAELSGNLDGRSLRRLHIGIPQLRELEEYKGKSDAQMKQILASGTLTKDQVFRAIAGKDNVVGDQAVEMSKTMSAQLAHLRALPEQYFERFSKSEGFEALKGKFGEILTSLDPDGERGGRIFSSLEQAFESVVGKVGEIDFEKVAEELATEVIPDIEKMVKMAGEVDWVGGAKELYGVIKDTLGFVKQMIDGMAVAKHAVGFVRDAANALIEASSPWEMLKAGAHHVLHPEDALAEDARGEGGFAKQAKFGSRLVDWLSTPGLGIAGDEEKKAVQPEGPEGQVSTPGARALSLEMPEAQAALNAARAAYAAEHGTSKFEEAGRNAAMGYAGGIRAGKDEAAAAGEDMVEGALDATNKAQESQSPSRKFRKAGRFGGEGYALGLDDAGDMAAAAGWDVADAALTAAQDRYDDHVGKPIAFDMDSAVRDQAAPEQPTSAAGSGGQGAPSSSAGALEVPAASPSLAGRPISITVNFDIGSISGGQRGADQADELLARLQANAPGIVQGIVEQLAIEAGV